MAQFTPEQREFIGETIKIAIVQMEEKVGTILTRGEAMQSGIAEIVEQHNTELVRNSHRVTGLVDRAIAANEVLEGSTGKIKESERLMTLLMADLKTSETNQLAVFAEQKTQLEKLTLETETALSGLDGKLNAAVAGTRADVETTLVDMNAKLHTFAVGIKAEVQALSTGGGAGKGASFEGKGDKGGGIDKKEVAVWKLPEDVTKIQYRHWSNAIDI